MSSCNDFCHEISFWSTYTDYTCLDRSQDACCNCHFLVHYRAGRGLNYQGCCQEDDCAAAISVEVLFTLLFTLPASTLFITVQDEEYIAEAVDSCYCQVCSEHYTAAITADFAITMLLSASPPSSLFTAEMLLAALPGSRRFMTVMSCRVGDLV